MTIIFGSGDTKETNVMIWHSFSKELSCNKLPVMAILKEFRELSGARGRDAHRGTTPPKYAYCVKMEVDKD